MEVARLEAWIDGKVAFCLRHWVILASVWCALVVGGAVAIPLLKAQGFDTLAWAGYSLYRVICPQRPDHSWFIAGEKMGFEQRDAAMFLAGALAGPLYILARRFGFRRLSGRLTVLLLIPILVDVVSQIVGLRDSDGFWRTLTGMIAVFAIAGWLYPQLDKDFGEMAEVAEQKARQFPAQKGETWNSRTSSVSGR